MDEWSDWSAIAKARVAATVKPLSVCNCIGPQRGQPVCPCQMQHVQVVDGRYVMARDLGPAPTPPAELARALLPQDPDHLAGVGNMVDGKDQSEERHG